MPRHNRKLIENESDSSEQSEKTPPSPRKKYPQKATLNIASPTRESSRSVTTKSRLPLIDSSSNRTAVRPIFSTIHHPPQAGRRKRPHPPLSSTAPQDSMAPWEGHALSESSFTSIPPPPPPPPAPTSTPTPNLHVPPQPIKTAEPERGRSVKVKHRPLPLRRPPRPPRLPPLRPVTNLSFSRSFTFSFFELPLHQSAQSRAERLRDLVLLLKQIQY